MLFWRPRPALCLHAGLLVSVALAPAALAQEVAPLPLEAAPAPAQADNRVIYDQAFFARYDVATAEDMLRLIPGVPAILDEAANFNPNQRGFGSGGTQVLIDGRRFPGKSNEITANLRRITPDAVLRVELISGAVEGISVQSEGLIVNVVLKEGAGIKGAGTWQANLKFNNEGTTQVDGLASYSGSLGALSYSIGAERDVWSPNALASSRWTDRFRNEVFTYPDGGVQELRPQNWSRDHTKAIYTGGATYDFARGDRVQLNVFYQTVRTEERDWTDFRRFSPTGVPTIAGRDQHLYQNPGRYTLEVSTEYEGRVGTGNLHVLALARRDRQPLFDRRTQIFGDRVVEISQSLAVQKPHEDIVRITYALPLWAGQSLEFGGEVARNTLDQGLRVYFDRDQDDKVEEIFIPTSQAHVQEKRGEAFATHRWAISPQISLESTLAYEASKLTNNYPFSPSRSLGFIKPRFDLRYRPTPTTQYRLLVERTVGQLDFHNFVAKYDFVDNEIDAGNPGLEPEKTWTVEAGYERRLVKDKGLLELRVFYQDITDSVQKVPLVDANGAYYSAQGNLPKATLYGAEIKASARLARIGLPNSLLSLKLLRQNSKTTDPFTGETRRLQDDRKFNVEVSYRHDITPWKMSYGFSYKETGAANLTTDLFVREIFWIGPTFEAFVTRRITKATTLRIDVQNLIKTDRKTRYIYAVSAMDGRLRRTERWEENRDLRFIVSLRGSF